MWKPHQLAIFVLTFGWNWAQYLVEQTRYTQETFIAEVEVLRQEMQSNELSIEGEFLSYAAMIENGISE